MSHQAPHGLSEPPRPAHHQVQRLPSMTILLVWTRKALSQLLFSHDSRINDDFISTNRVVVMSSALLSS